MANLYNIPFGAAFLPSVAEFAKMKGEVAAILLPTKRAVRELKEMWRGDAAAAELPAILPLGDIDEDMAFIDYENEELLEDLPPAIGELERSLILARLVRAKEPSLTFEQSVARASDLARLMDTVQMEKLSFDGLADLAPSEYSLYWRETLEFLKIAAEAYPKILAERGYMDPVARKTSLIARQIAAWKKHAPKGAIIAAGSTGSLLPIRELLSFIAEMPNGHVILPGLDKRMKEEDFEAVRQNHPQYGMKILLDAIGAKREDVRDIATSARAERAALASDIMLDFGAAARWREQEKHKDSSIAGISLLQLDTEREEAFCIALALRDAYEKGERAHLITPDRKIAKQVSQLLLRWNIVADDSAGRGASEFSAGNYIALVANAIASGWTPLDTIAILKHKFTRGEFGSIADELERILRGKTGAHGLEGTLALLRENPGLYRTFGEFATACKFDLKTTASLSTLLEKHLNIIAQIADETLLFTGDMGSQTEEILHTLLDDAKKLSNDGISHMGAADYPRFIASWLASQTLRPKSHGTRGIVILNSLGARLLPADFVIMAGLNEGSFPSQTAEDMWMSAQMRAKFGLPLLERKIGLSSHDFAEFFCSPRVLLTRSRASGALPSRWLMKLEAVLELSNLELDGKYSDYISNAAKELDSLPSSRIAKPAPKPPADARPKRLSATSIEKLYRDPYMIFAGHILNLRQLEPLDPEEDAADFGNLVHKALEACKKRGDMGEGAIEAELLRRALKYEDMDSIDFWRARFKEIARFMAKYERDNPAAQSFLEVEGEIKLTPDFTLSARADRIDIMGGKAVIVDYKTGTAPSRTEVEEGYSPQLPLEALILMRGGFPAVPATDVSELVYISLSKMEAATFKNAAQLAEEAEARLKSVIKLFSSADTPYLSRPNPSKVGRTIEEYSEFNHLARVDEWNR